MRKLIIIAACMFVAGTAHAQEARQRERVSTMSRQEDPGRIAIGPRIALEHTVKGEPYSADTVTENSQTLADGNRIARKVTGRVYRDSDGRIRREEDHADGTVSISIIDPVTNVSYRLDPQQHIAWKSATEIGFSIMTKVEQANTADRRQGMIMVSPADPSGHVSVSVHTGGPEAPLEKKNIDGIPVEGRRTTVVIPAGKIGNDLPITITSEEWRSPDLQILILTRYSDPRMGDSTYRVTNVVRAEPDPSLFQVPPGYTIREAGIRRHEESK